VGQFDCIISEALGTLSEVAGVQIKYARGSNFVYLTAIPGRSNLSVQNDDQTSTWFRTRDYIVEVCDLVLNEVPVLPQRGDVITETVGNKLMTFKVGRPDGGDQHYQFSDTGRRRIRIHTTQTGTTNA